MSKKNISLILLLVALAAIYVYFFTDLFNSPVVYVSARPRVEKRGNEERISVSFSFDRKCQLREVKVVPVAEFQTNKYARPVWHLISDTASPTLKGFVYNDSSIKKMKPAIPRMKAEPLQFNTKYRLLIDAGDHKGEVDFEVPKRAPTR